MLACLDVAYNEADHSATAACVLFPDWTSPADRHVVVTVDNVAPYVPGLFYQRELPCLLQALSRANPLTFPYGAILVDGYVWLPDGKQGLGAHLYDALARISLVIGVAKTPFLGSPHAEHVLRGRSRTPLYVTSIDMPPAEAAAHVRSMHGHFRLPTVIKAADTLPRART